MLFFFLVHAAGAITVERSAKAKAVKATFTRTGGMCPACEGMGTATDFDLAQLFDETKSLAEGAIRVPGYGPDTWYGRIFAGAGFLDPAKPIRDYTEREREDFLFREPTRVKVEGINLTYIGLVTKIRSTMLAKDVEAMQPPRHLRERMMHIASAIAAMSSVAISTSPRRRR